VSIRRLHECFVCSPCFSFLWIKYLIWFQFQIIKLLLLPNPTEYERNKVLRKIAIKSKIKDWHPGYKCSFQNFDEDMSKNSYPRQSDTYHDHNFVDEDTSSSSSSASASPKSMSHVSITNLNVGPTFQLSL